MAAGVSCRHILVTGPPGVGKTTLVKKACESLKENSYPVKGFYTEEVRVGGRRIGFDVITLESHRGTLAIVSDGSSADMVGKKDYRVGQYSVNLTSFEQTALPVLQTKNSTEKSIFVVDEIGKMELFSSSFIQTVRGLLNNSKYVIFATIPVPKGRPIPFVEEVRTRRDARVFSITRENRDFIFKEVLEAVKTSFDKT